MKILIVADDLKSQADYFEGLLRDHGHRTLSLYSRRDALQHLKHIWFDLVILDNAGLGEQILEKLLHPEVLLLATANTSDELVTKVREIELRLESEWQQALEFLTSGPEEKESPTPGQ